jgi:hypothetical protein
MYFDKELEEKDLIIWQLRFLYPKLSWVDLEKLYWVWKTPHYLKAWVDNNLTKNVFSARVAEQRLIELELLEESSEFRVSEKTTRGRKTKIKTLITPIVNVLQKENVRITFDLKLSTNG